MSKEIWVPVSDLADMESGELVWRVNLPPYVPADRMAVNVQRLGHLARLGGFASLRIGSYSGETTITTPGIDSVAQDGSATATMSAAISKAETQQSSVDPTRAVYRGYDDYVWTRGQVLLNTSEIDNRVGKKGTNVRDAKTWSKELNAALGQGIRGAVSKNLIERPDKLNAVSEYLVIASITTGLNLLFSGTSDLLNNELINLASYHILWRYVFAKTFNKLSPKDRRLSLIPVMQLDRVLAAQGLSRMLPLVKSLEDKE